ncbi:MAG TPA: DUF2911 domain-containing protein [Pyrinomonadaceae bacterium]|nr:DUF2911 domain-containing protein [Pyrinomonadaceae bacterium]
MSLRKFAIIVLVLGFAIACVAQQASKRGTAEATINGKKVSISYGRPSLQGRDMLAQATPGTVWRVGMNEATEITTDGTLVVDGKELKNGKYTLWVRKTGDNTWTLAFHPKTGVWGRPPLTEGYAAETPLTLSKASDSAEQLVIDLADKSGAAEIKIHWGTALLTGTFGVK